MKIDDRPTHITLPEGVSPLNPYSLFELYYPLSIIESIVQSTNGYKRTTREGKTARGKGWYNTTPQEIYIYLAIRIYMSLYVENETSDY